MALSQHEQNLLVRFSEKQFKNLPLTCLLMFKEEPKVPGFGNVLSSEEMLVMSVSLSVSLRKAYEFAAKDDDELCLELADTFAHEYSMNISDLLLEVMTHHEDAITTNVVKLIRYAKMERNPTIIVSSTVGSQFVNQPGFKLSSVTSTDIENDYFYELGKIHGISIVVDPLQENIDYAYLINGNVIDYRLAETNDESFITYKLSEDGEDLLAVFKPVMLQYSIDATGSNYKFFIIKDDSIS